MGRYAALSGAFMTQFMVIGSIFGFGVLFNAFEQGFGWSRTLLSSCVSLAFFMMGVLAFFAGRLSDRFGPRLVLGGAGLGYGIGFALMSQVSEPWQLVLIFATFIGLGMGTHDVVTLSTVARWFEQGRGLMTGIAKVGTALGQMTMPPLAAYLVLTYDLETTLMVMGVLAGSVLVLAASIMDHPPRSVSELSTPIETTSERGDARKSNTFRTLCMVQFLFFPTLMTVPTHMAVHGMDLGLTTSNAALLLSVMGGSSIAGRLLIGLQLDRMGSKSAYALCFASIILSLLGLLVLREPSYLFSLMVLYGFGHGGLFAVVSPTVASYFGMREHGALFGTIIFFGTISGAIGPILAGYAFDTLGTYSPAFLTLAIMLTISLLLVLTLPKPAQSSVQG